MTKQQFMAVLGKHGVTLDPEAEQDLIVDAPAGKVFCATGTHVLVEPFRNRGGQSWKADAYEDMAERIGKSSRGRISMTIKTEFVYPPVPFRGMDWIAFDDDSLDKGSKVGYGATEAEAIADLFDQLPDSAWFNMDGEPSDEPVERDGCGAVRRDY